MSEMTAHAFDVPRVLDRAQRIGLVVGAVATVACAIGAFATPQTFLRAWLVGCVYWLGISLGCLALQMIHHLTGGAWGLASRRIFEAASRTLPLLAVLMLPLLFGIDVLYPWAHPGAVAQSEVLTHKEAYLNPTAFTVRFVAYFAIWILMAVLLARWSRRQDASGELAYHRRMRVLSGPGLVVWAFTVTFAMFDWLMSLEPEWFSTIYGVYFFGGFGLSAMAFLIVVSLRLSRDEPMVRVLAWRHFHDYGKLMLAFVLLWAYFAVSQFLIIWAGNLPEEIHWFLHRLNHGWGWIGGALVVFHFAVPFALLLSRDLKRNSRRLAGLALFILFARWIDLYWQVVPSLSPEAITLSWLDLAAPAAVGGLWLAAFVWLLKRRPLLPVGDPYLPEAPFPTGTVEATPYPGEAPSHG
jgi:hypothetical protein